jgi:hypothetical protein
MRKLPYLLARAAIPPVAVAVSPPTVRVVKEAEVEVGE